jgi:hypothetical protein
MKPMLTDTPRKARIKAPKSPQGDVMNCGLLKNSIRYCNHRKLTTAIEGHLVKLIQSKVNVQDILPSDKITELSEAFKHYKEESQTL